MSKYVLHYDIPTDTIVNVRISDERAKELSKINERGTDISYKIYDEPEYRYPIKDYKKIAN